jgi:hypothetical protein
VYVNEPFAFSVSVPCAGFADTTAVSAVPSASVSFARTPVPAIVRTASSATEYGPSFTATGASFTAVTVMLTVAVFELACRRSLCT